MPVPTTTPRTAPPAPEGATAHDQRDGARGTARSRTGATWLGVCVGAFVMIALIVFMLQNTGSVDVVFLGMSGSAPLALTLLIAGVGVGVVVLAIGSLRIGQLRHRVRAGGRAEGRERPADAGDVAGRGRSDAAATSTRSE